MDVSFQVLSKCAVIFAAELRVTFIMCSFGAVQLRGHRNGECTAGGELRRKLRHLDVFFQIFGISGILFSKIWNFRKINVQFLRSSTARTFKP